MWGAPVQLREVTGKPCTSVREMTDPDGGETMTSSGNRKTVYLRLLVCGWSLISLYNLWKKKKETTGSKWWSSKRGFQKYVTGGMLFARMSEFKQRHKTLLFMHIKNKQDSLCFRNVIWGSVQSSEHHILQELGWRHTQPYLTRWTERNSNMKTTERAPSGQCPFWMWRSVRTEKESLQRTSNLR